MIKFVRKFSIKDRLIAWTIMLVLLPAMVHFLALFAHPAGKLQFLFITAVFLVIALFFAWVICRSILDPLKEWIYIIDTVDSPDDYELGTIEEEDEIADILRHFKSKQIKVKNRFAELDNIPKTEQENEEVLQGQIGSQSNTISRLSDWLLITSKLLSHLDKGENLRKLLIHLNQYLSLQWSSIFVKDTANNTFRVFSLVGKEKSIEDEINQSEYIRVPFSLNEGVAGKVFQAKKPFLVNRGFRSPEFVKFPQTREMDEKIKCMLCLPLLYENEVYGVLNCINRQDPPIFRSEDVEYAEGIASIIAYEIYRHQILKEILCEEVTGLLSRSYWDHCFKTEKSRATRFKHPCTLIIVDIDSFKEINRRYDYNFGDKILMAVSQVIKKSIRKIDFAKRHAGKFYICIPETDPAGAVYLSARIFEEVGKIDLSVHGQKINPTISMGVASFPAPVSDIEQLQEKALEALSIAKKGGKNRIFSFVPETSSRDLS
ncbi:diguanylate cyclase [Candidatus Riflebacteria bacterium]